MSKPILISYKVNAKQGAVRDIMKLKGYAETWKKNETEYHLPGTTLWKGDTTPTQAMEDLRKVARALNIELLGVSAIELSDWDNLPLENTDDQ
ncbi:hypothetical protein Q0590_28855 [Rhodocytophaga aerolata]|uniref:Uncharacterized protein n=1 Tax=Rhodocytophaga aerolata TaxID=455078 RepID=A0ABT8RDY4_9BACT|nr:hypothetical protein [Rhodocytophaga aerolata]MDO1450320.1 hypothetical protein [Rhodocytophaga aerolata]